jgi:ppGpp synthetase/RelA/SpoT-type nucleotidyltranferase
LSSLFKPPDKELVRKEYDSMEKAYIRLIEEVCFSLRKSIKEQKIEINGEIQYRVKDFESFYNKIIRYEIESDPFDKIRDIAGIRIICLYRSDLEQIGKIISENFEVIETDIKTQRTPSTEFGYMADHYTVKLSKEYLGPRYDDLKSLFCEIQVRTILMDAWDSISHHLDYKQEIDIPTRLRRDFYALSGLFYVADTHFEMFRDSVKTLKFQLQDSIQKDQFDLNQEVNLTTLQAYLKWKFPNRESSTEENYSDLITELQETGYTQFTKLERGLNKVALAVEADEKDDPPVEFEPDIETGEPIPTKYADIGIVRTSLSLLDPKYAKYCGAQKYAEKRKKYQKLIK